MERRITLDDIRKCKQKHKNELRARLCHDYVFLCINVDGPELNICSSIFLFLFLGWILGGSLLHIIFLIRHDFPEEPFWVTIWPITFIIVIMLMELYGVVVCCFGSIKWRKNKAYIKMSDYLLDYIMLGIPLPPLLTHDEEILAYKLLKTMRAYILDDRKNIDASLLNDAQFLFYCIWHTNKEVPQTHELKFGVGTFNACGTPVAKFLGTVNVNGELRTRLLREQCARKAGIGVNAVYAKLWVSTNNGLYKAVDEQKTCNVECDHFYKSGCSVKVFLVLKEKNQYREKPTVISIDEPITDEESDLNCRICYSSSFSHIVCTHCHRAVICPDCADQMKKLRSEQGLRCPNCRGKWSEILDDDWTGAKPAFRTTPVNKAVQQAAEAKEKKNTEKIIATVYHYKRPTDC